MNQTFTVLYHDTAVGSVDVIREGLYYMFHCRIHMTKPDLYRIILCSGEKKIDLGICVPVKDCFALTKRIAAKVLENDDFQFYVKTGEKNESFVPISEGVPFGFLNQLRTAKFTVYNNTAGVTLEEQH